MTALPEMFVAFWESLQTRHKSTAAAHRNLIALWNLGDVQFVGYQGRPPAGKSGIPTGWTLANLRNYKPDVRPRKSQ